MSLDCGKKLEHLEEIHTNEGRTYNSIQTAPQELNPGPQLCEPQCQLIAIVTIINVKTHLQMSSLGSKRIKTRIQTKHYPKAWLCTVYNTGLDAEGR